MLKEEILKLKKEKNAVILAHYYALAEVQEVADYVGDSYFLSKIASTTNADLIIFCGVRFMGESAKLLNYDKKVCVLDDKADCAMAHMANVLKIKELKAKYEDLKVVCYINSTLELKKHADVCVTSSNAVKICNKIETNNIFFIPDKNLGSYVKEKVKDKNIILNDGYCPIHNDVLKEDVLNIKKLYPKALVLGHPELNYEVASLCDYLGSTQLIIDKIKDYDASDFIILTERGILYELKEKYPNKHFIELENKMICRDMKLNTLEKLYNCLLNETNEIIINEDDRKKALHPLKEMLRYAN